MINNHHHWKKLFLFCFGLALGTGFCLKWMEADFWINGQRFTIMGLELFYSRDKMNAILSGLDLSVRTTLRYHLSFDFAFMAGVFPGIAALCMMASEKKITVGWKRLLFILAGLQSVAWGLDIAENYYLLRWMKEGVANNGFSSFHFLVTTKWIIVLVALFVSVPVILFKRKTLYLV